MPRSCKYNLDLSVDLNIIQGLFPIRLFIVFPSLLLYTFEAIMEKRELIEGDVVQLNPDHEMFPGLLVVVTEPKSFGCQGYLLHQEDFEAVRYKGKAFVRPSWEDMEYVGRLAWIEVEKEEE